MSTDSNIAKRSLKSTKSRGGCQRCRSKRIKCDEAKPACNICTANGVPCPGYAKELRWSSKHEVFVQPRQEKRLSGQIERSESPHPSVGNRPLGEQQAPAPNGHGNFNVTQGEASSSSGPAWDGMEIFDWPNFEFCGFTDLGLATPVMGQETSAELEALCDTVISNQLRTDPSPPPAAMNIMNGLAVTAPFHPLVHQSSEQEPNRKRKRGPSISRSNSPTPCTESVSLLQTFYRLSMPSAVPGFSDQDFVHHYFNNICTIYSCYDSESNPFRTYVSENYTECRTTYLAIQAMSASHLANFYPHMAPVGVAKRSQAWLSLQRDLRHAREGKKDSDRVLLCLLLLGLSSPWHSAANLGLEYLFAARDIVQKKLRSPQGVDSEKDEFFLSALMHWEMLASFVDPVPLMPLSGLKSPEPQLPTSEGPRQPHPWTGVVKELHFILAEIGRVLRRQRYLTSAAGLSPQRKQDLSNQDEEWMSKLEGMLLSIAHLEPIDIADYNDPKTPKSDLIRATEAYRYISLLEIYNAFPSILLRRLSQGSVPDTLAAVFGSEHSMNTDQFLTNIADFVMETIKPISIVSGACRLLPLVLLACAGHIRFPDRSSTPTENGSNGGHDDLVERRYFVEARMMTLSRKYPSKPLLQMMEIVKELWVRLDAGAENAHWMDVAHENGWQTIFG